VSALRVRAAEPEDAPTLIEIRREAAEEGRFVARWPEEVPSAEPFAARLRDAAADHETFLVAEERDVIVGLLSIRRGSRPANVHTADVGVDVRRAARGRGVGTALMLAAEAWARERGVRKICLEVFVDNEPARRLYRKLGYIEEGVRRAQYLRPAGDLVDAVIMAKRVDA
jgi:RimJ/RimL family protein N-acetyltransferase